MEIAFQYYLTQRMENILVSVLGSRLLEHRVNVLILFLVLFCFVFVFCCHVEDDLLSHMTKQQFHSSI